MNDEQLDIGFFKKRLIEMREELIAIENTNEEATETVVLDQSRVGRLSRMDALQNQAMSVESKRRRQIELRNITTALRRIEEGEYGYCLHCGEEINPKRLKVDPAAPVCINCAEEAENE